MHTSNLGGITSVVDLLGRNRMVEERGLPEISLTGRNTKEETAISRLYSLECGIAPAERLFLCCSPYDHSTALSQYLLNCTVRVACAQLEWSRATGTGLRLITVAATKEFCIIRPNCFRMQRFGAQVFGAAQKRIEVGNDGCHRCDGNFWDRWFNVLSKARTKLFSLI
ncbi:hypothetical protein EVAR_31627_1 [Eumeta japonica]|uniref:Uncharacterized protein n=1 Tax=Eumeta variegata TaxID=151549 RepID=A0A4C1VZF1_EUMVA|nr:hypothetical protein EVAR_31627_1 [Eumeta japonica]